MGQGRRESGGAVRWSVGRDDAGRVKGAQWIHLSDRFVSASDASILSLVLSVHVGHSVVTLWNVHEEKATNLETNLKDPSFMAWSRVGPQLAVGTCKGNLLLYNSESKKSQLLAGKHSKKITCGQWNLENKLALASLDRSMSINEATGELLEQAKLKYDPVDIQFAEQKVDDKAAASGVVAKENTVSINMGHQTILMYNMADQDNPVELAFQPKYGEIATYKWFGDGYMMVGFSKGYIICK
jgi:WD repeat-containing protein 19